LAPIAAHGLVFAFVFNKNIQTISDRESAVKACCGIYGFSHVYLFSKKG